MSRRPQQRNGLKLPRQLQQELGLNSNGPNGPKARHGRGGVGGRRDRRKAECAEEKVGRSTGHQRRLSLPQRTTSADYGVSNGEAESESEHEQRVIPQPLSRGDTAIARTQRSEDQERKPKSILKKRGATKESDSSSQGSDQGRSPSPGLVLDKSSKSFLDRAAQDDAEVAALEKKLGVRSKKLPKSFNEDGLADLLEGIDSEEESGKRKREGQEWLERKRRRVEAEDDSEEESDENGENDESGLEADELLGESSEPFDSEEDHFDGFDSEDAGARKESTTRKRENPYVAPTSDTAKPATKYIPPSLRKQTQPEAEALQPLRRQMQGQLNKLSEANLVSILTEVEKAYQTNARQDVTSTLVDLLLCLFCDPSVLQNTFVILHASFVASIYKVIGTDFGAEFVSQLVHRFDGFHEPTQVAGGKQSVNLISLLSHLFTFHVIGSNLVFDHIRMLLETLSEMNAELLLRIVRDAGPQLRHDDPSSLKDIVLIVQSAAARAQSDVAISVRTKFMIETITDLKNNKLKTEIASAGVASEHITRMRKVLGSLNSRNIRASEPLRIGLSDLKNAYKRGKWWLIGASWKENGKKLESAAPNADEHPDGIADILDGEEADLVALARQHRMNTAVRRSIFIATMSANDYQDAHLRLLKLRLKRSQQQEIPRVLLHCAGAEEKYNPYYVLIAKTLCADKRLKMAFQFSLWDFFKRMGEKGDDMESDDEDDQQEVQLKEIVNTARMFGTLVADGTMSLGILKTLDLALLKEQARMFVEVLLVVVISKSQEGVKESLDEDRLARIFARCKDTPQMIRGLRHFLKQVVRHTDLASSKAEARQVKLGCGVAMDTLKVVSSGHGGQI